jgi:protein-L-isoaspartate(D-aspartate) O-methyltransferase
MNVLLLSPGNSCRPDGNFGDPHLVALASYVQSRTDARVEVIDLDYERLTKRPNPERVFSRDFSVVGISCYSSYDYLTSFYLAKEIRKRNPEAVLVVGGYHASARPTDFLNLVESPLEEESPFDHVVIGEGELPLTRIVEAANRGERLSQPTLGPEPLPDLDDLPPLDWSLLDRYRAVADQIGSQAAISFSRGCPFGCSFCMERSKGESIWRAWTPQRAEVELLAFNDWLPLANRTLFISDAVFGLRSSWRREMLDRLARLNHLARKTWTLTRVDCITAGDIDRYARANFGVGIGLESGDPHMLRLTGKIGQPDVFYDRFLEFADRAGKANLPWGANVIVGHPGETVETMTQSAEFAHRLFTKTDNLTGFLSVDPFRFYPGCQVDRQRSWYESEFGAKVHRPRWWNYSEQSFTSEWVDPSAELDYRAREKLTAKLFRPIVDAVGQRFAYNGNASNYFRRGVERSRQAFWPGYRLRFLVDYQLWQKLTGAGNGRLIDNPDAADLFREARSNTIAGIRSKRATRYSKTIIEAVVDEPRERFVPKKHVLESYLDKAMPLTDDSRATISALHAYLTNFELLQLQPGDQLLDIGGGTGYGAAVASRIVGPAGHVTSYEIIEQLAQQAAENLADRTNVTVVAGSGLTDIDFPPFNKAVFGCAVSMVPQQLIDALPEGGRIVAPLQTADSDDQTLTCLIRHDGKIRESTHGAVRYVRAT